MKYCTKCGDEINANEKFCTRCGNRIDDDGQLKGVQINNILNTVIEQFKLKITISKKSKVYAAILICLLIVFVGLYQVGNHTFSKDMAVERFKDSLISANAKKIAKNLTSSNPSLKINEVSVQHLIKYLNENPAYTASIINSLEAQSKSINIQRDSEEKFIGNTDKDFVLVKRGKKFLIFDNYVIEAKPYFINLNIGIKGVKVNIGEDCTVVAESNNLNKEIGPFILGIYEVKAEYSGAYVKFQKKMEVKLTGSNSYNKSGVSFIEVPVNFEEAKFINVDSKYDDAELYINGKNTGVLIKDAKNFGPVDSSSKIYAVRKFEGREIQSSEVQVSNRNFIYLEFTKETSQDKVNSGQTPSKLPFFNIVSASSELKEVGYNHETKNVIDNNKTTAWVEGSADDGIGEWIKLENDSTQNISGIKIINGYTKGNDLYYQNNRVSKITLEFSDGSSSTYDLKDGVFDFQNIDFGKTISTKYIKITIAGIYKGSIYKDTCISEISVY